VAQYTPALTLINQDDDMTLANGVSTLPKLVGAGAIFIDDIVLPDGTTYMGRLGGGVIHALMGAAIWGETPGLSAFAGNDLSVEIAARLHRHLDIRGLVTLDVPQARAWQIFEHDGTRRELHRVKDVLPFVSGTKPSDLPTPYRAVDAYYLLQGFEGVRPWAGEHSGLPGLKLWEPNQLAILQADRSMMRDVLSTCAIDVISPNLKEAQAIYGNQPPEALADEMIKDGAKIALVRLGSDGVLAVDGQTGERVRVPSFEVERVVDETGAGNTFNGGFITGLMRGESLTMACVMGTVSASFCIETVGVIDPDAIYGDARDRRLRQLMMTLD
jgi:hypothetical protein